MATAALGLVGGAVGGALGGPFGAKLGFAAGTLVGGVVDNYLFNDPINQEGPRLTDLNVQISSYGVPIQKVYGTIRVAGNVIWAQKIREVRTAQEVGGAGGICGGAPSSVQVTYTYYCTFAVGVCEGPIDAISKIWADTKLIYNVSSTGGTLTKMAGLDIRVYPGDETQEPSSIIETYEGTGNVPAFRGLCYVIFNNLPLANFGNRIPNLNFEVQSSASFSLVARGINADDIAYDSMTSTKDFQWMITESANQWIKFNAVTGEQILNLDYDTEGIPGAFQAHHDSDELVNIYTAKYTGGQNYAVKLDQDLNVIETGEAIQDTNQCVVVCNPQYPYVWYTQVDGDVYCIHRDSMNVVIELDRPSGKEARMICVNHTNGDAYILFAGSADTVVRKCTYNGSTFTDYDVSAYVYSGRYICYDNVSNQVIIGSWNDISGGSDYTPVVFFDGDDLSHIETIEESLVTSYNYSSFQTGVVYGKLNLLSPGGGVTEIDVNTKQTSFKDTETATGGTGWGLAYNPVINGVFQVFTGTSYPLYVCLFNRATPDEIPLSTIVADICNEVGLSNSEIDTTDLTDIVKGFRIDRRMSARNALQPLMDCYFFDAVESDSKIVFKKRDATIAQIDGSDVSISEDELASHREGEARPQELEISRKQEIDLPALIDITYLNVDAAYQTGNQRSQRLITSSFNKYGFAFPIVLSDDEAKQLADKHLRLAWVSRDKYRFTIPKKYFSLNAGDVVQLTEDSAIHTVRLENISYNAGVLQVEGSAELSGIYTSSLSGAASPVPDEIIEYPGPSNFEIMDIPALEDAQDAAGLYAAAAGFTDAWNGCMVYKSSDGGATWAQFSALTSGAKMGRSTDVLSGFDYTHFDNGNTVNVRLVNSSDTLSSITESQILNGANAALLGNEIIQFQTASLESNNTYTLSGLLRGRRGTEYAVSSHSMGDRFVFLEVPGVFFEKIGLSEENVSRIYKGVSFGQSFANGVDRTLTAEIKTLMPYSPAHIIGTRDSNNDLTITWKRRTRIGGAWVDGHDVPVSETSEAYEVDILGEDGVTAVRSFTGITSQTQIYTNSQQSVDFEGGYAFGQNSIGDVAQNFPSANEKSVSVFTTSYTYDIGALEVYYNSAFGLANARAVIYADSGGGPHSLVAVGDELTSISSGWNTFAFSGEVTLAAGDHWIGILSDTTITTYGTSGSGTNKYNSDTYSDGPSDPFGSLSDSVKIKPCYATQGFPSQITVKVYQISDEVGRGFSIPIRL